MNTQKFINMVCAVAHFLGGYAGVLTLAVFGRPHWALSSTLGVISWAAVKEFWFDPRHEGAPIFWSGVVDFSWYMAGMFAGLAVGLLAGR